MIVPVILADGSGTRLWPCLEIHYPSNFYLLLALGDSVLNELQANFRVYRPWGYHECIEKGEGYLIKRIVVKPAQSLSLQTHEYRSEHWVVVQGTAMVTKGDETFILKANQSTHIPKQLKHRLFNAGLEDLEIIEVQSGAYLGEDDIVRYEDAYGRSTINA